ncbi:hypothetical protein PMAA_008590 [Talaromyces marneffei ATCC 18224]|uniref:Uncharacterized protein n=1 Tax=Talaromyces marneffei (strain ATCC 18224 / CBS 334.59 / QM 7333) TaxID=441960 RepID=B6QW62_TALMQ|nr:hypothetical protein PMAA_008590 [Talaromyces marneffei ATCC 18224]
MTTEALKNENRLQRFNPKAWIGYLVGYDSTNVYRIWNPSTGNIIRARDVIFNEDEGFTRDIQQIKDDLLGVTTEDLTNLLSKVDISLESENADDFTNLLDEMEDVIFDEDRPNPKHTTTQGSTGSGSEESSCLDSDDLSGPSLTTGEGLLDGIDKYAYPTPPESPPSALLAASVTIVQNDDFVLRESSKFAAGMSTGEEGSDAALVQEATNRAGVGGAPIGVGIVRPIGSYTEFGEGSGTAFNLRDSMERLIETRGRHFFKDRSTGSLKKSREYLIEFPTRTVDTVLTTQRGELNPWRFAFLAGTRYRQYELFEEAEKAHLKSHNPSGSWTTVPIRKAKGKQILDSIAARFDLELKQYNAVNAFVNAKLDEEIFMRIAPGYREPGKIYRLNKALYGLRRSPLL